MEMEGPWDLSVSVPENKYNYNGKELNTDFGLDWSDYGARWYDASIGRWAQVDPLAEKYTNFTPYCYVGNMPTKAIDPDGRIIKIANNGYFSATMYDLGILYSTKLGRAIINSLARSNTVYKINGHPTRSMRGTLISGTRYNSLTNNVFYRQSDGFSDGVSSPSYVILAHELYHAYQDELKKKRKETGAMQFENYIRDVMGIGGIHRKTHGGVPYLKGTFSAFDSNGESVDLGSVKVYTELVGEKQGTESEENENDMKRDNTAVNTTYGFIMNVVEFMNKNGIQTIYLDLNKANDEKKNP